MLKFSSKIAISIIIGGLFVIVSLLAVDYSLGMVDSGVYLVLAALVFYVVTFGAAMGYHYAEPVKNLLMSASSVSKGKKVTFSTSVRHLGKEDEIGALAITIDQIIKDFERKKAQVEESKESAETKFKTKELLSNEVIRALEEKVRNRTAQWQQAHEQLERLRCNMLATEREMAELKQQVEKLSARKKRPVLSKNA
ncbi:MAG: hypothetical protein ACREHG_07505 [Candidatus Saccharimonadales bacterium]